MGNRGTITGGNNGRCGICQSRNVTLGTRVESGWEARCEDCGALYALGMKMSRAKFPRHLWAWGR